jgi:protein TonB
MSARAIVLLERDGTDVARWIMAAAIVLAAHVGLVASYLLFFMYQPPGAPVMPAVIIDMAPMPVAPLSPIDAAVAPEMVEAQPPPEPQVTEPPPPEPILEPPPPVEKPVVALPEPPPLPPPPEVREEQPKPEEKPPESKRVERKKPAPRTTAAPRSDRNTAERPVSPSIGASAAAASWRDQVVSQLQRAKRYPSGAQSRRDQGVVTLNFSLSRNGAVLARSIMRRSGHSDLDQEVLAMVMRAQPFPPFPSSMTQARINLTVPVRFSLR